MRPFAAAISVLIAAVCTFSRPTEAAQSTLALGPVTYEGDIPDYFQRELEQVLVQTLQVSHGTVLELRVNACQEISCLLEPARDAKSVAVILVRISKRDRDYAVELIAHAADDGAVLAQVDAECSVCGQRELLDMLPAELTKLRARALEALSERALPPRLVVEGTPVGARLRLDGDELGPSPVALEIETGKHALEIAAPGHAKQVHRWEAVANVEEVVDFALEPTHVGRAPGAGLRVGGWLATWIGVAGIGAGTALAVLDGRPHQPTCTPALIDVNGACPNVYTTATAGYTLLGVGIAGLGAGIGLLVHGYRQRDRIARVQFAPGAVLLRF